MLFGDKMRFAIEWELDEDPGGTWLFGRACYWVCGDPVGDYELGTTLRDVLFCWERIAGDAGKRSSEYLMSLCTETLVNTLHDSMFGGKPGTEPLWERAIEEQWARHNITPSVDVFDDWRIYLVEDDTQGRFAYNRLETDIYRECALRQGEFDRVLTAAIQPLLHCYDRAVGKEQDN